MTLRARARACVCVRRFDVDELRRIQLLKDVLDKMLVREHAERLSVCLHPLTLCVRACVCVRVCVCARVYVCRCWTLVSDSL
eukprot:COSAG03_NODE_1352_length_4274_cov_5.277365_3_plen_82_part_00